jgi:tetratricopeptide (TPR) repeat protein
MKKLLSAITIIILFLIIIFYVFTDKSYRLTKKAEEYYRENNIKEANKIVNEALALNKLNRKALILKNKITKQLEFKDKLEEAEKLYNEALKDLQNKKLEEARVKLMSSLDLINSSHLNKGLSNKAERLREDIIEKIHKLTNQLTEKYIEKANERYKAGDLIEAYEFLESIEINDPNIELYKSKIAFELGERRYNNILGADFKVTELEIRDAIYWFSQVNKDSEYYNKSRKYIKTLRKYLKK